MERPAYPVEPCISTLAGALHHKDGCIRCHGPDGIHGSQVQVSEACGRQRRSTAISVSRGDRQPALLSKQWPTGDQAVSVCSAKA
jgi:hypothetical protein